MCVFARANGRRLGYKFALQAFKDAQEKAGVGPYPLHDYRRSVARRLDQGGIARSTGPCGSLAIARSTSSGSTRSSRVDRRRVNMIGMDFISFLILLVISVV